MIGQTLSHFKITAKLGEGGMGEVYRADDTKLGREVAIKVLPVAFTNDPDRLARFEREAKLLASLSHQHIAGIHEVGELNRTGETIHFLVMELAEGEDLATRLERGALPVDEVIGVAKQIAEALEVAHEKGIVHRDLKPQNIKLSPDGSVKVLDFGLAKLLDPDSSVAAPSSEQTHSPTMTLGGTVEGVILGTAAYMSPEQVKGQVVDKRADIWAFGVVLWEMLTGRRLFSAPTAPETLARVLTAEADLDALPEATPPALRRLLRRTLTRKPHDRLRDIGDARIALGDLQNGQGREPLSETLESTPRSGRVREAIAWTVAVLALASAVTIYLYRPTLQNDTPPVIRSILPLPNGVSIELDGTRAGMPALSPDGTSIAFGGRRGTEPLRIWVLDVATSETHPLSGTENGYRPFWSPDGRKIGFFTWSNLSITSSEGGPVTGLTRARNARGGTWGSAGQLVFAPFTYGPLRVTREAGGVVEAATHAAESTVVTHRFPSFLPDSKHFLYLRRHDFAGSSGRSGHPEGVFLGQIGDTELATRVLDFRTNAVYSLGYILYVQDRSLIAQPFDAETRRLSGEPRPLVDHLLVNRRFSYGVFSASDNGVLAFLTGRQQNLSRMVWRDRSGKELGQLGRPVHNLGGTGFDLSPDGSWAAVSAIDPATTNGDVWLHDLRLGAETRLGSAGTDDFNPIFTPDSKSLFYSSTAESDQRIVRRELASGEEQIVFVNSDTAIDFYPRWLTQSGHWLVAEKRVVSLQTRDIVRISLDGNNRLEPILAGPEEEWLSQLSPDGRWFAYVSDESGRYEVYAANYPDLTTRTQISRSGGVEPRWSADGTELYFKQADNWVVAVPIEHLSGTVAVGEPEQLFRVTECNGTSYIVGPEGRFLTREPVAEQDASAITLLTNWPGLLER